MKNFDNDDTIVALSTPLGRGAIAVIRLSGSRSLSILNQLFSGKLNRDDHRKAIPGQIRTRYDQQLIDQCVVTYYKSPNSYTGEDVVEISCHCNPLIIEQIMGEVTRSGGRVAQPGEFTKRAFLNHKMDLSQAEAVAALIESRTRQGLIYSLRQLEGGLSQKITVLRDRLVHLASLLEINLDFTEEDLQVYDTGQVLEESWRVAQELDNLLHTYDYGRLLKDGVKLLLLGKPNVGKSSLLNALVEKERALVSEIPGTTRDYIEEYTQIEGFPIQIVDTAGIRETLDMIEKMGVQSTLTHIESSDLILAIFEIHRALDDDDLRVIKYLEEQEKGRVPFIVVLNKSDLGRNEFTLQQIHALEEDVIEVSAKKGNQIPQLKQKIKAALLADDALEQEEVVVSTVRHKEALKKSSHTLHGFIEGLQAGQDEVILASELRSALDYLGEIVGEISSEDLLNHIFGKFCIGK